MSYTNKGILNVSFFFLLSRRNGLFRIYLSLTGRSAPIYKVLSIDYSSALELVNKEYQRMSFQDLDLLEDLKVSLIPFDSQTRSLLIARVIPLR